MPRSIRCTKESVLLALIGRRLTSWGYATLTSKLALLLLRSLSPRVPRSERGR